MSNRPKRSRVPVARLIEASPAAPPRGRGRGRGRAPPPSVSASAGTLGVKKAQEESDMDKDKVFASESSFFALILYTPKK